MLALPEIDPASLNKPKAMYMIVHVMNHASYFSPGKWT